MEYTSLGSTGLQVSRLCLGSMTFGRETDEVESRQLLDRFVERGGNFIDTADGYSNGVSEQIVGKWLRHQSREDLVVATKVRFGSGLNKRGLSRKHILTAIDASLQRLGTSYVDLYQIHMWDASTPLVETLRTLDGLVRDGKVRYLGISNFSGWQLQRAVDICREMHLETIASLQPLYNLLDREAEWELIQVCANEGLAVIPWSPLRGGWLTGKFQRGAKATSQHTRISTLPDAAEPVWTEGWSNYDNPRTWTVIDSLLSVCREVGRTPAAVALNWLLHRPGVTAPIVGARSVDHLNDNLGCVDWKLDELHMNLLEEVSYLRPPYPYGLLRDLVNA